MKKILITGATSGIGLALTQYYSSHKNLVYACGRNNMTQLESMANNVIPLSFDIAQLQQVKQAAKEVDSLDLLILNAGNCQYINDPRYFDSALFESVIKTNLISQAYLLECFLPLLNKGGQIAFMGSSVTYLPLSRAEAYGASKAGLDYLAMSLAVDLKSEDIHVSIIEPGFVKTPLTDKNDFPMPFLISSQQACNYIVKGLEKKKTRISFPKRMIYLMKLISLMPEQWWINLARRIA